MELVELIENNNLVEMENQLKKVGGYISVEGQTLLMYAIQNNNSEMVKLILEYGGNPNGDDLPLSVSVLGGNPDIVRTLLQYGANKSRPDNEGLLPIDYYDSIIEPNPEIQKMLE